MKKGLNLLLLLFLSYSLAAQATFPQNGVEDQRERFYALTGASVHTDYETVVENATLVIRKGKVISVTANGSVPEGAVQIEMQGKHIYPAFIDAYSDYGMPEPKAEGKEPERKPQMLSNKEGAYSWNEALKPEFRAHEHFTPDAKTANQLREAGFGTVAAQRMDGISRGSATLVALGDERPHDMILMPQAAHALSFRKGTSTQSYPNSLMGMIALLRQTYYDAQWYEQQAEGVNLSLDAWNQLQQLPQLFAVGDRLEVLRAARLGAEFDKTYIIKGNGDEYQRLEEMAALNTAFILPLNFPEAYDVEDPYDAQQITLAQLKHWEMAPANPGRLAEAGIPICLTADGLDKPGLFLKHLRKAVQYGLSESDALKAVTQTPAALLGAEQQLGSLEKGKIASFIVTDGSLFDAGTEIKQTWIKGKAYAKKEIAQSVQNGTYELKTGAETYVLEVEGSPDKPKLQIKKDTTEIKVSFEQTDELLTLSFAPDSTGRVRLSGTQQGRRWSGRATPGAT